MRRAGVAALALACALSVVATARADWVASGTFVYVDREFDETGFTGDKPAVPVRFADVEIVDANGKGKNQVLATGATGADGTFSILVPDGSVRDVYARAITRSDATPDLHIEVRANSSGKTQLYAAATPVAGSHAPTASLSFGTATIPVGQGGEAFNIYDQMLKGMDYVASLTGARPDVLLAAVWGANNGVTVSRYDLASGLLNMRDSAGYDDTVTLHEMGHYVMQHYGHSNSPATSHTFAQCEIDPRLAYEEGWATYWGNSALRFRGEARSEVYLRSNGAPGPGNVVRVANLETDTLYGCRGAAGEVNVFSFLWDISDGPDTPDATPGVDDAHDQVDRSDADVWAVVTGHLAGATDISLEDFWDRWFLPPASLGDLAGLDALAAELGIEYHEDAYEPNDSAASAAPLAVDAPDAHATLFRDSDGDGAGEDDSDLYAFSASAGQAYALETVRLHSGADTRVRVIDSDGVTTLAFNDDRASGDPSSRLQWTAPRSDTFYVGVDEVALLSDYGVYDLRITALSPTDDDGDGFDTSSDCNDLDPSIYPGAPEVCDGIDQDCDGHVDNGFDLDLDGFTTCQGDCDDDNPSINPSQEEIPANGLDDNCDGRVDEAAQTDVVSIIRAEYKSGPNKFFIEATSSQQPGATLTLVGFGPMSFDPSLGRYVFTSANKTPNPGTVTVESSGGGSDTATVR